jgi:hypothetical protein
MYLQSKMPDLGPIASMKLKIEDRLRNLAIKNNIDTGSNFSLSELLTLLRDICALSPTEFRDIRDIGDFCEKVAYANIVDPIQSN